MCYVIVPARFSGSVRILMEEITCFLFMKSRSLFTLRPFVEKQLERRTVRERECDVYQEEAHLVAVLFHGFRGKLMEFVTIELRCSAVVFFLDIFRLTVVLLKECVLNEVIFLVSIRCHIGQHLRRSHCHPLAFR